MNTVSQLIDHVEKLTKTVQDQDALIKDLVRRLDEVQQDRNHGSKPQELYYQKILEKMVPGAGHRTLQTKSGSTIIPDLVSPDDWNPETFENMPSFLIEVKNKDNYKELLTQLLLAKSVLPRELLIGVLFVNPSRKRLEDVFEIFHIQGIQLAYFDHHDHLWWFDGQNKRPFTDMWKSKIQVPSNKETDVYTRFLTECCIKVTSESVSTMTLAKAFMGWSTEIFGSASIKYQDPRKYVKLLWQSVLQKEPWCVAKVQEGTINCFRGIQLSEFGKQFSGSVSVVSPI